MMCFSAEYRLHFLKIVFGIWFKNMKHVFFYNLSCSSSYLRFSWITNNIKRCISFFRLACCKCWLSHINLSLKLELIFCTSSFMSKFKRWNWFHIRASEYFKYFIIFWIVDKWVVFLLIKESFFVDSLTYIFIYEFLLSICVHSEVWILLSISNREESISFKWTIMSEFT